GLRAAVAGRRVIWLHAVSVGEVMAAATLIGELRAALPGWVVAVSTTTETGQRLARERLAGSGENGSPVFYLPLDFRYAVRRYLRVLRPSMVVLMESELWPRLMMECERDGVPMAVVNARVSDRSLPRYLRLRRLWRPLLAKVSLYLAQSEETAERLQRIGAPAERVRVTGNLKYDVRASGESALTAMLRERLAGSGENGSPVFYLPLDFRFAVRRYLRVLGPAMVVLMESELWPRLMMECERDGVPMAVVNARVSDRSLPRYLRLRRLWRPLLAKVSLYLAQSEETAERLVRMGAPAERVRVTGNLKYDIRASGESELTAMLRERLPVDARVVVCGSTLEGEETMLLEAWPVVLAAEPRAVMVLAPRRTERFAAVAGLVAASGFGVVRASEFREIPVAIAAGSVFLLDTIGDLASAYSLGVVAFVGGSLVAAGGHNPLEPAQFAVPVLTGPSFENFRGIVEAMQVHDAIRMVDEGRLAESIVAMLRDVDAARAMGERGRAVFEAQAGATTRTVRALMELIDERVVRGR
ncbi:MAG: glycosyltransferase N-terminal domain-containing protein, partial [Edaphobacter sp.]